MIKTQESLRGVKTAGLSSEGYLWRHAAMLPLTDHKAPLVEHKVPCSDGRDFSQVPVNVFGSGRGHAKTSSPLTLSRCPFGGIWQTCPVKVQAKRDGDKVVDTPAQVHPMVHEVLRSPGQPLDPNTRSLMESRFGYNFAQVRVHTDAKAAESARALNAVAYTVGSNVVFASGSYMPGMIESRRLLAHELSHVIQQTDVPMAEMHVDSSEDSLELEADRIADKVIKDRIPIIISPMNSINNIANSFPALQRKADTNKALPVPQWGQLPPYYQNDLALKGYGQDWFSTHDDVMRLTVLNLYVKLKGMDLWIYVGHESSSNPGNMEFESSDVAGLKDRLAKSGYFSKPEEPMDDWSSREMRANGSLHFKSLTNTRVQAHIDKYGLIAKGGIPIFSTIVLALNHLIVDKLGGGYKDVFDIREILLAQGWDPIPLKGALSSRRK